MAKTPPKATAPAQPQAPTAPVKRLNKAGRVSPIVKEHVIDTIPRKDPRTGKLEIPGQPTSAARSQTPDNVIRRVRATRMLYYQLKRRHPGDVFTLAKDSDFNERCMVWVTPRTPESITTSNEAIKAFHDGIGPRTIGSPNVGPSTDDEPDI